MLFDDIPSREPLLWFRYSRAALRIQCLRVQACYIDSILNAYCVRLGGCLTDHLAERIETDLEQLRQLADCVRTHLNCVDLLANWRESLE